MFKNNIKIAFRSLKKNKLYTGINIFGLSIGISAALLIFQIIKYEMSFNKDFTNYDRIVRVVLETSGSQGLQYSMCVPIPAMEVLATEIPQFKSTVRVCELWASLTVPNPSGGAPVKKITTRDQEVAFFVESSFFTIFNVEWLSGSSDKVLDEVGSIVLTKKYANLLFGSPENAMDQTLMVDNLTPVIVKGVIDDFPNNVDFNSPFFVSYKTLEANAQLFYHDVDWGSCSSNNQMYALLGDNADINSTNAALALVGQEQYERPGSTRKRKHIVQPLSDLHYNQDYGNSGSHIVSLRNLKILGIIGLLIILMACFNFINLATAQSILRTKEVGVRKTLGGKTNELIKLFMTETSLIVSISLVIAVGFCFVGAPYLNLVSHVPKEAPFLSDPATIIFLLTSGILVAFLAGLYPSISLARSKPSEALKNISSNGQSKNNIIRKILVVTQFSIAQILIIGAVITVMQMEYINGQDLGFTKDLVYNFEIGGDEESIARQNTLKNKLLEISDVVTVSLHSDQPQSGNIWSSNFRYDTEPEDANFHITQKYVDDQYATTYGLQLLAGKWLTKSDTIRDGVVNMTTLSKLGVTDPHQALGKTLNIHGDEIEIVGVTSDFHTKSLHQGFEPLLMTSDNQYFWGVGIKIRPDNVSSTLAQIQNAFDQVLPEQVLVGSFFDENIAQMYEDDQRMKRTSKAFGFLAILISCLGLFGLATHAASRRLKEIGIRKVLGAKANSLLLLLSKDFMKLVLTSLIIATPIAYFLMQGWLKGFTYRIEIEWWVFAFTGLLATFIAFISVGYQSLKAALANPVDSLKAE